MTASCWAKMAAFRLGEDKLCRRYKTRKPGGVKPPLQNLKTWRRLAAICKSENSGGVPTWLGRHRCKTN